MTSPKQDQVQFNLESQLHTTLAGNARACAAAKSAIKHNGDKAAQKLKRGRNGAH